MPTTAAGTKSFFRLGPVCMSQASSVPVLPVPGTSANEPEPPVLSLIMQVKIAQMTFKRPCGLCRDHAADLDRLVHVSEWLCERRPTNSGEGPTRLVSKNLEQKTQNLPSPFMITKLFFSNTIVQREYPAPYRPPRGGPPTPSPTAHRVDFEYPAPVYGGRVKKRPGKLDGRCDVLLQLLKASFPVINDLKTDA